MTMRDVLIQEVQGYESDGQGGRVASGDPINKKIECRASFNTSPEVASEYGTNGEQVLYVITSVPLVEEARYFFADKPYTLRYSGPNRRLFYSILVEVKE